MQPFLDWEKHEQFEKGVYFFLSGDNTTWQYPKESSAVFYIGQSSNLLERFQQYSECIKHVIEEDRRDYEVYYGVYEFAARFGVNYCTLKTYPGVGSKRLEGMIFAEFMRQHGSLPIANHKVDNGAWEILKTR